MKYHRPVMVSEILSHLNVLENKKYIDATLGDGGHSLELLKHGAYVLGIDYDKGSLNRAVARINDLKLAKKFVGAQANFMEIDEIAQAFEFDQVDGIIFDLGYSSSQLNAISGLSFMSESELDMRLDKNLSVTAADLINALNKTQLQELFSQYGEERYSKTIAEAVVEARNLKEIQTTKDLVGIIESAVPSGYEWQRLHPATRVFQALRIVVNDELENLKKALPRAARLLKTPGGRMAIISFHSLEDKVVKHFGKDSRPLLKEVTKKPLTPSKEEVSSNPRARSAKLRIYEIQEKQSK